MRRRKRPCIRGPSRGGPKPKKKPRTGYQWVLMRGGATKGCWVQRTAARAKALRAARRRH